MMITLGLIIGMTLVCVSGISMKICLLLLIHLGPQVYRTFFPPSITNQENDSLCEIPSLEQIKATLSSLKSRKSSGPDGMPPFFKACWFLMGNKLANLIQHFFSTGTIPKALKHTFLAMISKVENPTKVYQFRTFAL